MKFTKTAVEDLVVIEPTLHRDERGWFAESFNEKTFNQGLEDLGLPKPTNRFVQDNHSFSHRGVLRGMHYQAAPRAQGKLVRVLRGSVFDVAVDIRANSPTFGKWIGVHLSETNQRMFWIPEGFAHGFLALEDGTEFFYKVTDFYSAEHERTVRWDDPRLAIAWPSGVELIVNAKDSEASLLASD